MFIKRVILFLLMGCGVLLVAYFLLTLAFYNKENPIDPINDLSQHLMEEE